MNIPSHTKNITNVKRFVFIKNITKYFYTIFSKRAFKEIFSPYIEDFFLYRIYACFNGLFLNIKISNENRKIVLKYYKAWSPDRP